ncbi:MAG: hypothetical protein AVDCRST_MAG49-4382, partial [uncultured Thermomicrobiales bacterium]
APSMRSLRGFVDRRRRSRAARRPSVRGRARWTCAHDGKHAPARQPAETQRRPAATPRPGLPRRHRRRPPHRLPVALVAQGTGVRQRHHMLAPAPRLARGRRLGAAAHAVAQLDGRRGGHRPEPGERGQLERPGQRGRADRPQADGPRHPRLPVPPGRRPWRHPAGRSAVGRHRPDGAWARWSTPSPPIVGPRGEPGRPRKRPAKLHADKGYDYPALRRALRVHGITPLIARLGIDL